MFPPFYSSTTPDPLPLSTSKAPSNPSTSITRRQHLLSVQGKKLISYINKVFYLSFPSPFEVVPSLLNTTSHPVLSTHLPETRQCASFVLAQLNTRATRKIPSKLGVRSQTGQDVAGHPSGLSFLLSSTLPFYLFLLPSALLLSHPLSLFTLPPPPLDRKPRVKCSSRLPPAYPRRKRVCKDSSFSLRHIPSPQLYPRPSTSLLFLLFHHKLPPSWKPGFGFISSLPRQPRAVVEDTK